MGCFLGWGRSDGMLCVVVGEVHRSSHTTLPTQSATHKWLLQICLVHRSSHTNLPTQSVTSPAPTDSYEEY